MAAEQVATVQSGQRLAGNRQVGAVGDVGREGASLFLVRLQQGSWICGLPCCIIIISPTHASFVPATAR